MYKKDLLAHRLHSEDSRILILQIQDPDGEHTVAGDKETDRWTVRKTVRETGRGVPIGKPCNPLMLALQLL